LLSFNNGIESEYYGARSLEEMAKWAKERRDTYKDRKVEDL
jgi:hypothetical protein